MTPRSIQGFSVPFTGLTAAEAAARPVPPPPPPLGLSFGRILRRNVFTLFNAVNLFLGVLVLWAGSPKNALFLGVAICNTILGVAGELRARRVLRRLTLTVKQLVTVLRDDVPQWTERIVPGDVLILGAGDVLPADGVVLDVLAAELDESALTGESVGRVKAQDDRCYAGTVVLRGKLALRAEAVGKETRAGKLMQSAGEIPHKTSRLLRFLNRLIGVLTVMILPLGAVMFLRSGEREVLSVTASIIGMIPEGLILLCGASLTLAALRLAYKGALVQSIPAVETLARADVLCMDKTGTLTKGELKLDHILCHADDEKLVASGLAELLGATDDQNPTACAVAEVVGRSAAWQSHAVFPFSADRKWSGAVFATHGTVVLGGADLMGNPDPLLDKARSLAEAGQRVLGFFYSPNIASPGGDAGTFKLPQNLILMALLVMDDQLRADAAAICRDFAAEEVTLEVCSGDHPSTVERVAEQCGIASALARQTPEDKEQHIKTLQAEGRVVCMLGDGVNDVAAMRRADCGISFANGASAARDGADIVLTGGDAPLSALRHILAEGRQVINNMERVASLYLVKTIYAFLLTVFCIAAGQRYPFEPLQITLVGGLTVGIPTFFLAFRRDVRKPTASILSFVLRVSLPGGLLAAGNTLLAQHLGVLYGFSPREVTSLAVVLLAVIGLTLLLLAARPLSPAVMVMIAVLVVAFLVCFTFFGGFFGLASLWSSPMRWVLPMGLGSIAVLVLADGIGRRR